MLVLLIGCLGLLAGCAADLSPARAPVKPGEEFALALGETVAVDRTGLAITFERVIQDSRCPMNARCIWEGNARIALKVGRTSHELNTSSRFSRREKINDFVVELRRLEPDRLAGSPTEGYVATLFVGAP